jgi:hypothetical protein
MFARLLLGLAVLVAVVLFAGLVMQVFFHTFG